MRQFSYLLLVFLLLGEILGFSDLVLAEGLETGKDRRTDGISTPFETATQYSNLFTGSASYSVPIEVPEGPGGFTPSLRLRYDSDQGNGWLGLGWNISGLPRIERSTKYGIPNYIDPPCSEHFVSKGFAFDRFDLFLNDNHYEIFWDTKRKCYITSPYEHFKIEYSCKSGISGWKITDKSGVTYTFEGIPAVGRSGSRFYRIKYAVDPNGNLISYEYVDGQHGDYYPLRITYGLDKEILTGQPFGYTNKDYVSIDFELKTRNAGAGNTEKVSNYKGGSDLVMDRRISRISLRSAKQGPFQEIFLNYGATSRGHQSLLEEVQIKGTTGSPLLYKFDYQGQTPSEEGFQKVIETGALPIHEIKEVPNLWPLKSTRSSKDELYPGVRWVDINGDALADMVWGLDNRSGAKSLADKPLSWKSIEKAFHKYGVPPEQVLDDKVGFPAPNAKWPNGNFAGTELLDVNNDGFIDIVHSFDGKNLTWINDEGKGWQLDPAWALPQKFEFATYKGASVGTVINEMKIVDVNGDGFPDIVKATEGAYINQAVYGQKGWHTVADPIWRPPVTPYKQNGSVVGYFGTQGFLPLAAGNVEGYFDLGVRYIDLNGDGLNDILVNRPSVNEVWINTGHLQKSTNTVYKRGDPLLFSITDGVTELVAQLDATSLSEALQKKFSINSISLPADSTISVESKGSQWWITDEDKGKTYIVRQESGKINIYGDQWRMPKEFLTGFPGRGHHLATQILDINQDNLPDIVYSLKHIGSNATTKVVMFNNGNGWGDPQAGDSRPWVDDLPLFAVPFKYMVQYEGGYFDFKEDMYEDNGVSFADFNGDGAPDIGRSRYDYKEKDWERHVGIWFNRFQPPLLVSATNPFGGRIGFQYRASHAGDSYKNHHDEQGIHRMPAPKQVVSAVTIDDGVRSRVTTGFDYRGGRFDFRNREFRGFRSVLVKPGISAGKPKDYETREIVYTFFQDDARKGRLSSVRDGSRRVYAESFNIYGFKKVAEDARGASYETLLKSTFQLDYDSVLAERDLLYDFNFDVTTPPWEYSWGYRPCKDKDLSYSPWFGSKSYEASCMRGPAESDLESVPSPGGLFPFAYNEKPFKMPPFGGYAYNGIVEVSPKPNAFPALTIQAWIAPDWSSPSTKQYIIRYFGAVEFYLDGDNKLVGRVNNGKQWMTIQGNATLPGDEFTHIAFSFDGKAHAKLYVNGRLDAERTDFKGPVSLGGDFIIGSSLTASIDELKIFQSVVKVPRIRRTDYLYDKYANLSELISYGDLGDPEDDVISHTDYVYRPNQHILNRPGYVYTRSGGSFANDKILRASWYEYDERGNPKKVIDWGGVRIPSGAPLREHATNPAVRFTFDARGNPTEIYDARGYKTVLSYDPAYSFSPIRITNARGHATTMDYYGVGMGAGKTKTDGYLGHFGQVKRITDPNGVSWRFVYDGHGWIRAIYGPNDGDLYPSLLYVYDLPRDTSKAAISAVRVLSRNEHLKSTQSYLASFGDDLKYYPSKTGMAPQIYRTISINTSSNFDANYLWAGDYPFPNTKPDTVSASVTFQDGFGRSLESLDEADPAQNKTILSDVAHLDGLGRIKTVYKPEFVAKPLYDAYGVNNKNLRLDLSYQPPAVRQMAKDEVQYDAIGRIIKLTGPDGAMTTYEYDQWTVTTIDPNGHKKVLHYDAYNCLIKVEEFFGMFGEQAKQQGVPFVTLDSKPTPPGVKEFPGIDSEKLKQLGEQGAKGQGPTLVEMMPIPAVTTYDYDLLGNLVRIRDPAGNEIRLEYDALGRKVKMTDPDMGGKAGHSWRYHYDLNGNLIEVIDAKEQHIGFDYDELNRLVKKSFYKVQEQEGTSRFPDSPLGQGITLKQEMQPPVIWRYDDKNIGVSYAVGRLVKMEDASGYTQFWYDNEGQITKVTKSIDGKTYVTELQHDAVGRTKSILYPDNEPVTYSYGRDGGLSELKGKHGTYVSNTVYDAVGNVRRLQFGNGIETHYSYDDDRTGHQLLTQIRSGNFGTAHPHEGVVALIQDLEYAYDRKGNIKQWTDHRDDRNSQVFGYDELDRLTAATRQGVTEKYRFDMLGNLIEMDGKVHHYEKTGLAGPHAVTKVTDGANPGTAEEKFSYDANGNLIEITEAGGVTTNYAYDFDDQLVGINKDTSFVYDGFGSRVKKTEGNNITLYPSPLFEVVNGKVVKYYKAGGGTVARWDSRQARLSALNALLHYHPDHLGSLNALTNAQGQLVAAIEYYPYGRIRTETGAKLSGDYKFTGKEQDNSGLYYFGARYYEPQTGKFLTPDPLDAQVRELGMGSSQSLNSYSYVINNPINLVDLYGLKVEEKNPYLNPPPLDTPEYEEFAEKWGTVLTLSQPPSGSFERDIGEPRDIAFKTIGFAPPLLPHKPAGPDYSVKERYKSYLIRALYARTTPEYMRLKSELLDIGQSIKKYHKWQKELRLRKQLGPLRLLVPGESTLRFVKRVALVVRPSEEGLGPAVASVGFTTFIGVPLIIVGVPWTHAIHMFETILMEAQILTGVGGPITPKQFNSSQQRSEHIINKLNQIMYQHGLD